MKVKIDRRTVRLNISAHPDWLATIKRIAKNRYDGNISLTVRELCRRALEEPGLKETAKECRP